MNLAEKLNKQSMSVEATKEAVIDEIFEYFENVFNSGRFEKEFEKRITADNLSKRLVNIGVSFWNYTSGCSDTYFRISCFYWHNPEGKGWDSKTYKGIKLSDIQKELGRKLLNLTEYHLKQMGFNIRIENKESWLDYYDKNIVVSW